MLGFIGMGAAGGNIADEAAKEGFPAVAINYSQKDLDSLEYVKSDEKLKLVGSEGVGKNREEAIRLMDKNWESAISFIKENFSIPSIEVIVVAFSTGGGSGSGMAPVLLEMLIEEMPDKTFVAAPVLPDLSEVIVNQMNCLQTSEEISRLNVCVLPIDNEQVRKMHPSAGKNRIFSEANRTFVKRLAEIVEYTEKQSKNGVLDKKDLRTIFNTRGVATFSAINLLKLNDGSSNLTEKGIAKMLQESWRNSIFTPVQYNRIVRAGVVLDGQETLMDLINFQRIFENFESGMPVDLFEGYYHTDTGGKIYSVLSGLGWYNERLAKVEEIIKEKQQATENLLNETNSYESKVQGFSTKIRKSEKPKQRKAASDILSKYRR